MTLRARIRLRWVMTKMRLAIWALERVQKWRAAREGRQEKAPDSDSGSGAVPKLQRNCGEPIPGRNFGDTVGNYLGPAGVALRC